MLQLLAPEHRVTLLTPAPRAGQPPPAPLPPGASMVTYGGGRDGERTGGTGPRLGAARAVLGAARGVLWAAVRALPLQSGLFFSADLRRQLRLLAPRADLAMLQLVRLVQHRADLGATPVLVDLIDDLALNFSQRAAIDRWWLRPALALEGRLLARTQRLLARSAAGVLLVCERDRREVIARLPPALAERVRTVALAVEPRTVSLTGDPRTVGLAVEAPTVPLAVEPGGVTHDPDASVAAVDGPPRLVFTGNLGYFVNADAISWWLREVWPLLAARRPELQLVVAGDRPRSGLRRALAAAEAAGRVGAVTVIESPPGLAPVLAGAVAALAPMRCGSGVPVKILEAWSQDVPVVASPWAAAGTTGVSGEDLLVASSPRQWVQAVEGVLQDPQEQRRLAANGRRRLQADYSQQQVKRQLLAAVAAAVSRQAASG